ncbi:MAG: RloB domain-containing protein [Clostridia bacterium]|nr:RloB domain-containing protein [Clostridia bacterium]
MSLKPLKKSDLGKDWLTKRRDSKKSIYPEYHLIVTEGIKTEQNYFNAMKEIINQNYKDRIQIKVSGEGDNTVNLFEIAKNYAEKDPNGYKHIWVVYDTDDFPKENIDEVLRLCNKNSNSNRQYHAIWSNQCVELWYLLHFSFMQSDLHRREYFPKLDDCLQKIGAGKYEKNRKDMYDVLKPYMDDAIRNAKALKKLNKNKLPSESSPGTMIFELVEKIKPYL